MNSTQVLRVVAVALVAFQVCCLYLFPTSWVWSSRQSHYADPAVSAVSLPIPFTWTVIGLFLFAVLMTSKQSLSMVGVPAWRRRAVAFLVDMHFGTLTLVGSGEIAGRALRASRIAHAASKFPTTESAASELVMAVSLSFLSLTALFLYFVFPLTMGKQTVGCFVMGTKVTPPFGMEGRFTWSAAIRRTWHELNGVCSGTWFNPRRDPDGNTWYDLQSGCRVVQVEYKSVP